jgi:hypothetical protein
MDFFSCLRKQKKENDDEDSSSQTKRNIKQRIQPEKNQANT